MQKRILSDGEKISDNVVGPKQIETHVELLNLIKKFDAAFLFIGHGSKGQFNNVPSVLKNIDQLVEKLNSQYGKGNWLAIFGGDNFDEKKPDVSHILKYLKDKHHVPLLAIQSDAVLEWGGVDKHIDYVRYVPTIYIPKLDEHGKPKQSIHWGGLIDGQPQGPTGIYLGNDFISKEKPLLKGVIAIGGGPIGLDEAKLAFENGIDVTYIRSETKYPEVNGLYGSLDEWALENNLLFRP